MNVPMLIAGSVEGAIAIIIAQLVLVSVRGFGVNVYRLVTKGKIRQTGQLLGVSRKKEGEAEEDMAKHLKRRPGRYGSLIAGMEPAGSPVTVRDGDYSSPDAQRGTGGPKS